MTDTVGNFFHISLQPKFGVTQEQVEERMNLSLDWFRYNATDWVVYSRHDAKSLCARLKSLVEPDGRLFICELNIGNYNGWMSAAFWEWLKKQR
jgi:hypothetical protein